MITISLGNVGSGKTASIVREMYLNPSHRKTYSNIITKGIKNCVVIDPKMIIKKEIVGEKKKRSGETEAVYESKLHIDYWKDIKEPINVILDEAHTIMNSRRAMSKTNQIITDWMALIRRVLGSSESGYGELTLISQLFNRVDIIAREMATKIKWHVCHYIKTCKKCGWSVQENSDDPEPLWECLNCGSPRIHKHTHVIEVKHFRNSDSFLDWKEYGSRTYHKHYYITDIEKYFKMYDTLQWDNMFSEFY